MARTFGLVRHCEQTSGLVLCCGLRCGVSRHCSSVKLLPVNSNELVKKRQRLDGAGFLLFSTALFLPVSTPYIVVHVILAVHSNLNDFLLRLCVSGFDTQQ